MDPLILICKQLAS